MKNLATVLLLSAIAVILTSGSAFGAQMDAGVLGAVTSAEVPEPAIMLLLGTGLIGLGSIGRKTFAKKR